MEQMEQVENCPTDDRWFEMSELLGMYTIVKDQKVHTFNTFPLHPNTACNEVENVLYLGADDFTSRGGGLFFVDKF